MIKSEMEEYKECVSARLSQLSPFMQSYALGDFSESIEIPEEEDEFTELLVGLTLMVDDIREMIQEKEDAITKLQQTEGALRQSEEKYRTILENIEDGYFEVDSAGNFTFFNDSLRRMLGYSENELMGMNNREYMDDENAKKVYQAFNAVYQTGKPAQLFDWEVIRKDGARRFVEASVSLIEGPTGAPTGFRGIVRNITERKRAEEELRKHRDRLEELVGERTAELRRINEELQELVKITQQAKEEWESTADSLPELICLVDDRGRIIRANRTVETWNLGRVGEVKGRSIYELLHADCESDSCYFASCWKQVWEQAMRGQPAPCEVYDEVSKRHVFMRVQPGKGEAIGATVVVVQDITERKRAEDELKEYSERLEEMVEERTVELREINEELQDEIAERKRAEREIEERRRYLEGVLQAAPDAIVTLDARHRIVEWNPVAERVFGYSREEAIGHDLDDLITSSDVLDEAIGFTQVVLGGGELSPVEAVRYRKDGSPVDVILAGSPIVVGDEVIGTVAAYSDITERKRAEEELKRRNRELATLNEATTAISSDLSLDAVLQAVAEQMIQVLGSSGCALSLWHHDRDLVETLVDYDRHHPDETDPPGTTYDLNDYPTTRRVLETGHPVVIQQDDPTADEAELALMESQNTEVLLMLPLIAHDRVVGLVELVDDSEARQYMPEQIRLAESLAAQAAIAIENARLYEEIEERRVYLEGVLGAAPDAIVTLDAHHQIVEWNPGAERLFGYSREEVIGQNIDDLVTSPDVLEEAVGFTQTATAGGEIAPVETVRHRRDGSPVDVIVAGSPIQVGDELIGVVAIYTDITERKRAEEALRESEERHRNLFDRVPVGLYRSTPDGRFLDANPALVGMLGYPDMEALLAASAIDTYATTEDRGRWQALLEREGVVRDFEVRLSRRDGEVIWMRESTRAVRDADGRVAQYEGTLEDITERKRAEEALRESEERYRDLFENANDLIQSVAPDGSFVYVNRAWREALGYDEDEIASLSMFDIIHPDSQAHCMQAFGHVMAGESLDRVEAMFLTKDERTITVEGSVNCNFKDGIPVATRGMFRDVTERKWAEEQLQRYAAELEQANEEVKQFAYIVSHDLRAPLVNLKGFSTELRFGLEAVNSAMDTARPHLDEKQRQDVTFALEEDIPEALGFINSSVTHMDRFIQALLTLSRLGRRELHLETVDVKALVQATLQTLSHQIEERRGKVTVGPLPEVVADRTSMEQIVGNLLGNAVKYLDPDRAAEIEITAKRGEEETIFRIRDNGRGIAEEDMPKVFVPFRRVGRQDVPGEGMGLPYVQALVRRHGGRIWCESELGVGTTLSFTIPNNLAEGDNHG